MQIKCRARLLNAIILPCTTSMPGLRLQFDFRTLQKVKLTWQKYTSMVKWQCYDVMQPTDCMLRTLYSDMKRVFSKVHKVVNMSVALNKLSFYTFFSRLVNQNVLVRHSVRQHSPTRILACYD